MNAYTEIHKILRQTGLVSSFQLEVPLDMSKRVTASITCDPNRVHDIVSALEGNGVIFIRTENDCVITFPVIIN